MSRPLPSVGTNGQRIGLSRQLGQAALAPLVGVLVLVVACGPSGGEAPAAAPQPSAQAAAPKQEAPKAPEREVDLSGVHFNTIGWETDFSKHSVPLEEIISGGPPRDGIPPIDFPKFVAFGEADEWLRENEPVVAFELGGEARAYPIQILMWHEIVNDDVAGTPVAITFCPLCNTAIAFDREVEGLGALRFGTTGNLRKSDLVMWDDKTESWWQQITGEAIVGELTGTILGMLPASNR